MNILIVGLGSIALKHIKAIKTNFSSARFYAIRSSKSAENKEGVTNIFSFDELKDIAIDFAIISNPTSHHARTIKNLIPKKIPLFIEKPLFSKIENESLIQDIEKTGITTYIACNLRFLECLQFTKRYLQDKRINEVNIYCGSYLPAWRPGVDFRQTYSANRELGGGVHIDLIHEIDYSYWLFGKPEKVNKVFSNKSSLSINAYDYANYTLSYAEFNTSIILNYFRKDPKRTLEIVLENETILVNLLQNKVYSGEEVIFSSDKGIIDTYESQLNFFINEVVLKGVQFNTAKEAYEILKICLQED